MEAKAGSQAMTHITWRTTPLVQALWGHSAIVSTTDNSDERRFSVRGAGVMTNHHIPYLQSGLAFNLWYPAKGFSSLLNIEMEKLLPYMLNEDINKQFQSIIQPFYMNLIPNINP